jgi:hypothetical protein
MATAPTPSKNEENPVTAPKLARYKDIVPR